MANKDKKNATSFALGHKAAEKWTFEETRVFFEKALEIAKRDETYHWADILVELDSYGGFLSYILSKYPIFEPINEKIKWIFTAKINKGALKNEYNPAYAKFYLTVNSDWVEKSKTETTVKYEQPTPEQIAQIKKMLDNEF